MKLAFIVNTYENPLELSGCLISLKLQWMGPFETEIHVADNSENMLQRAMIKVICEDYKIAYHETTGDCYTASEQVISKIEADWVCFASSDGYYVPGFSNLMMETAHRLKSDLVYCDCLYDPRLHGRGIYSVLTTFPEMRWIDKMSFIVRHELFKGWPQHEQHWRDGAFVEQLVRDGRKLDKAKGVLVVHN